MCEKWISIYMKYCWYELLNYCEYWSESHGRRATERTVWNRKALSSVRKHSCYTNTSIEVALWSNPWLKISMQWFCVDNKEWSSEPHEDSFNLHSATDSNPRRQWAWSVEISSEERTVTCKNNHNGTFSLEKKTKDTKWA